MLVPLKIMSIRKSHNLNEKKKFDLRLIYKVINYTCILIKSAA